MLIVPTQGSFNVGDTINTAVFVSTADQAINAVEAEITYEPSKLEVLNLSKTDSVFKLWIQEPTVSSDQSGVIGFSGVVPSPGFIGQSGQLMTVSFKVKDIGNTVIGIKNAQVLANDGLGSNVLSAVTPASLSLVKPKPVSSDINGDGKVDLTDLSILISNWGSTKNRKVDLNGDGKVNLADVSILLSKWTQK